MTALRAGRWALLFVFTPGLLVAVRAAEPATVIDASASPAPFTSSIEALVAAYISGEIGLAGRAQEQLKQRGPEGRAALVAAAGEILRAENSPKYNSRRSMALGTVRSLGPAAKELVPVLIAGIPKWDWPPEVALTLELIGEGAIPELEAVATADRDDLTAIFAHATIAAIISGYSGNPGAVLKPAEGRGLAMAQHVRFLASSLESSKPGTPEHAAQAAGVVGPVAYPLVPNLVAARQRGTVTAETLATTLGRIGRSAEGGIPALLPDLDSPDRMVRLRAFQGLKEVGGPRLKEALPAIMRFLSELKTKPEREFSTERRLLLETLGDMGPDALPAIRLVMDYVKPRTESTIWALSALGGMGPGAREAIPLLVEAINDASLDPDGRGGRPNYSMRDRAVASLMEIDLNDARVRAGLLKAVEDGKGQRYSANNAVAAIGPADREMVSAVVRLVRAFPPPEFDASRFVGGASVGTLYRVFFGKLDGRRRDAAPELIQLARDSLDHSAVLDFTLNALERIGALPDEFVPVLFAKAGLPPADRDVDGWVFPLLEKLGPRSRGAAPLLLEQLRDGKNQFIKARAAKLLGRIGRPDAAAAIPILEQLLAPGSEAYARFGSAFDYCDALLRLDPGSDLALRELETFAADISDDNRMRYVDAHALLLRAGRNAPEHREALLALLRGVMNRPKGMGGDDIERAAEALLRLSTVPEIRRAAIDWLVGAAQPEDGYTYREWAIEALLALPASDKFDRVQLFPALRTAHYRAGNARTTQSMSGGYGDRANRAYSLLTYAVASAEPKPSAATGLLAEIALGNSHTLREAAAGKLLWSRGDFRESSPLE